jgi:hypothetical protein
MAAKTGKSISKERTDDDGDGGAHDTLKISSADLIPSRRVPAPPVYRQDFNAEGVQRGSPKVSKERKVWCEMATSPGVF